MQNSEIGATRGPRRGAIFLALVALVAGIATIASRNVGAPRPAARAHVAAPQPDPAPRAEPAGPPPRALRGAVALPGPKLEIEERGGAFGFRSKAYLFTAAREGITTALPYRTGPERPTLSLALQDVRMGDRVLAAGGPAQPELRKADRTVAYARGAVEERYVLRKEGVEQVFVIAEVPEGTGDLVVRSSVRTNLTPPEEGTLGDALVFKAQGKESLSISKALVFDGAGRKLALELAYAEGSVTMTVPAGWMAEAKTPITIDPLIMGPIVIDPNITSPTERVDVAYSSSTNEWMVVWGSGFGATSEEIYAQRVSASGTLVGPTFLVSDSTDPDFEPVVAYSATANKFLVAWVNSSTSRTMLGRFVNPDATMSAPPLAIAGPSSLPFDQPAIAADGSGGWYVTFRVNETGSLTTARGCLVSSSGSVTSGIDPAPTGSGIAWPKVAYANGEYMAAWSDIGSTIARRVSTSGVMLTSATVVATNEGPYVGDISAAGNKFLVTWSSSNLGKVRGRILNADGAASITFATDPFDVFSYAVYPASAFSATSDEWYVIHETSAGPSWDLNGNLVSSAGVASTSSDLIATNTSVYRPRLAWNSQSNEMLVVYESTASDPPQVLAQRVSMSSTTAVLQGRWKFDEGTGTVAHDSSSNGNDGALTGGVTWTPGKSGSAILLDGSTGYVSVPVTGMPSAGAAQSISWWMNYASVPTDPRCVIGLTNDTSASAVQVGFRDGKLTAWKYGGGILVQANAPQPGVWHHVAYTFSGVTHRLYVDGQQVDVSTATPQTAVPDKLEFGRWSGGSEYFAGKLDEVHIYGGTLTVAEVANLASDPTLEAYFKFDEGTGITTRDVSGMGHHGTLVNGPTWTTGRSGSALNLDGSDDSVSCILGSGLPAANGQQTLTCWMNYPSVPSGVQAVLCLTNPGANSAVQAGFRGGALNVWNWGGNTLVSAPAPSVGSWHHFAYTFDGTTHRLYVDGVEVNSSTVAPQTAAPSRLDLGFTPGWAEHYAGNLDEVRIYSRALAGTEVTALATAYSLEAYFKFDEGTGTATADSSGNGHHGTLQGAQWAPGRSGTAVSLNGTDAYVSCIAGTTLPATNGNQTLSWWMNVASNPTDVQGLIDLHNDAQNCAVQAGFRNGNVTIWNHGGNVLAQAAPPPAGSWHHFAYTFDGTTHKLYVNGILADSSTVAPQVAPVTSLVFGRWNGGPAEYFAGLLDEVRIYGRTLTAAEVAVLAQDPSLAAYYKFDEGSGFGAADSSGNGHDGTLSAGAAWTTGIAGGALLLDGANYVDCQVRTGLPANNAFQTVAWWMNVASNPSGTQCAVDLHNDAATSAVQCGFRNGNVSVWNHGGNVLAEAIPPAAGAWHHFAYTFDGTTHRLYVDGAEAGSSTVAPQTAGVASLVLGRWNGGPGEYFVGALDDTRIYTRALSAAEVLALSQGAPPGAPTNLVATAGNAQVSLTWNAVGGATSYKVFRRIATNSYNFSSPLVTGLTSPSYLDQTAQNVTQYFYVVRALNAVGESGNSNEADATPASPPAAPTNLQATGGNNQVSLTWTASAGATAYKVFRRSGSTSYDYQAPLAQGVTAASYVDQTAVNGTTYFFVVRATNVGGESPDSNEAQATPAPPGNPPAPPTNLQAFGGNNQVTLTWTASSGATSYKVFRREGAGSYNFNSPLAQGITTTSYADQSAQNNTTYFYVVRATNAAGDSGSSNEASATPTSGGGPAAPVITTADKKTNDTTPIIAGTSVAGATIKVYFNGVEDGQVVASGTTWSYHNTGSPKGDNLYVVTASATDGSGTSAPSNPALITVDTTAPDVPAGLAATPKNGAIALSWSASGASDTRGYNVYRKLAGSGSFQKVNPKLIVGTKYLDSAVQAGQAYTYRVTAVDDTLNEAHQ